MNRTQVETESDLLNKEFLKGKDLSGSYNIGRPAPPQGLSDLKDDITFMQIDCDYYSKSKY